MPKDDACTKCELHRGAKSVCCWGRTVGSDPGILILGEAPGYQEDLEGRPFIGRSGELLNATLKKAGITDYYLTNSAKCFPKANPKPNPTSPQVKACAPYLDEEIAKIRPDFILALGNVAAQRILGYGQITKIAGKEIWSEKYKATVYPALHPAAILRAPGTQSAWEAEIMRFGHLVRGELLAKPPVKVDLITTPSQATELAFKIKSAVAAGLPLAYDVEATYGLEWWHKDYKVWTIAFSISPNHALVLPVSHPKSPADPSALYWFFQDIKEALTEPGKVRIAHNQLYDDLAILRIAGYRPLTTWDTMIGWQLIDENSPKGLKWLGRTVLGWPDWGIETRDLASEPLEKVAFYNGCDAAATVALYLEEKRLLAEMPQVERYFMAVPQKGVVAVEQLMVNGVHIDEPTMRERVRYALEKSRDLASQLPVDNPNSTQQIGRWLYGKSTDGGMDLPIIKRTPGGAPSTDEDTIKRLAKRHPEVRKIVEYRRWFGSLSRSFRKWIFMARSSFDGRAHFEYRVGNGADTGRLSGYYHTTPRDPFERNVLSVPPEGWVFMTADLAQIEARLAAWAAAGRPRTWSEIDTVRGRKTMLWAFHEGRDIYVEMAAEALGKPESAVTKDKSDPMNDRQVMGKVPTLASLYEITAQGLQRYAWEEFEIDWSIAEATHLWKSFRTKWSEFPDWHERERKIITSRGWTASPIGRVRRLPAAMGTDQKSVSEAVRTGLNMPIQGVASDIVLVAMDYLVRKENELRDSGDERFQMIGHHHDALNLYALEAYAAWMEGVLQTVMERSHLALEPLGLRLPDGLVKAEVSTGPWGGTWRHLSPVA